MWYGIILDLIVAGLLVATIWYCVLLNRRLTTLRDAQVEMQRLIQEFDRATQTAQGSISDLRRASEKAGSELQARIDAAKEIGDELAYAVEAGNRLAERLTERVTDARRTAPAPVVPGGLPPAAAMPAAPLSRPTAQPVSPPAEAPRGPAATPRGGADRGSQAERDLMQALQRFK